MTNFTTDIFLCNPSASQDESHHLAFHKQQGNNGHLRIQLLNSCEHNLESFPFD
jgi:hypothetical protein